MSLHIHRAARPVRARQSSDNPSPSRRRKASQAGATFLRDVRGYVPTAQRFLVQGVDEVEETVEALLRERRQWKHIDDSNITTIVAAIRQAFLLGAAYGTQLAPNVLRGGAR